MTLILMPSYRCTFHYTCASKDLVRLVSKAPAYQKIESQEVEETLCRAHAPMKAAEYRSKGYAVSVKEIDQEVTPS